MVQYFALYLDSPTNLAGTWNLNNYLYRIGNIIRLLKCFVLFLDSPTNLAGTWNFNKFAAFTYWCMVTMVQTSFFKRNRPEEISPVI